MPNTNHKSTKKSRIFSRLFSRNAIEYEREDDGRWIAEAPELPGVLAYGATGDEALAQAEALALRVLAKRLVTWENGPC